MSPPDAKLYVVFVVKLLLWGLVSHGHGHGHHHGHPHANNVCMQTTIPVDSGNCVTPSGYNESLQNNPGNNQTVKCLDNCNVLMIYPGPNSTNITLTKDDLPDQGVIVILQTNNNSYQGYLCVSVFASGTGYCWNKETDVNTSDFHCNDLSSDPSQCKSFNGSEKLIITTDNEPSCDSCESIVMGDPQHLPDLLSGLISSAQGQIGNNSAINITAANTTGVALKLHSGSNINVGFTKCGNTEVLQSMNNTSGLFSSVGIPAEATNIATSQNGTLAVVVLFSNIKPPDAKTVFYNNTLLAIEMEANVTNLTQPVKIDFDDVEDRGNASCVSWNGQGSPNWTTEGCDVKENGNSITCECYHLTFFALLMTPPETISSSDYKSLSYITSVGCGLSMLFLAVGLFMHYLVRKGKASRGTKILMNLFVAMFLLDLSFLVNESIADLGSYGACVATAAVMHYAMLATVSWFFVEALHLYCNMWKSPIGIKHYLLRVGAAGWGTPAVVVTVLLILQKYNLLVMNISDGTTSKLCWIADANIQQGVNIGYYAVVFLFTFAMFITTVRQVILFKLQEEKAQRNFSIQSKTLSILSLLFLLGITWAVAFFSFGPLLIPSYYIFTILNSFQGFFLFFYYYKTNRIIVGDTSLEAQNSWKCTSNTGADASS